MAFLGFCLPRRRRQVEKGHLLSELCFPIKHAPVAQLDRAPDFESVVIDYKINKLMAAVLILY